MEIKRFNDFLNEGVRELMTGKSKEELKKAVDKISDDDEKIKKIKNYDLSDLYDKEELKKMIDYLPSYKRLSYIDAFNISYLYSKEEYDEIVERSPNVIEHGKWYYVDLGEDDEYVVLVHSNGGYRIYQSDVLNQTLDGYHLEDDIEEAVKDYLKNNKK